MTDKLKTLKAVRAALDEEIGRAEFWDWWGRIHRGTFEERMAAMRLHPGRARDEKDNLLRVLHDLNIQIEIDRKVQAGLSKRAAIDAVADAACLSSERVRKIYRKGGA